MVYVVGVFAALILQIGIGKFLRKYASGRLQKGAAWYESLFKDLAYQIVHLCLLPVSMIPWKSKKHQKTPIILVHGYFYTRVVWLYYLFHLRREGLGPIYTVNLGYPFSSIDVYREILQEKITKIAKDSGKTKFHLVGHSMGGLVCIATALKKNLPFSVEKVITIGSPLYGTKAARLAVGKCAEEMKDASAFTTSLREKMKREKRTAFFHIGSKTDQVIIPQSSSFSHEDTAKEYVIEGTGHLGLMASLRVKHKLVEYLR